MAFSFSNSMIILIFLNSCIVFKPIDSEDDIEQSSTVQDQTETTETISSDKYYSDLSETTTESLLTEKDLSFVRNSSMITREIPKPWIKSYDLDNRRSEEWADPPLPLQRVRFRSSETDISSHLLPNCGKTRISIPRIVGGSKAREGAYPWIVLILNLGDPWCGGSILNERWVLTAAHCFMLDSNAAAFSIRVGNVNRTKGTNYKISKIIIHERFHLDNMFNSDIALLKIEKRIIMGKNVGGVCLPTKTFEEPTAKDFIVVGWGQTSFEAKMQFPEILQQVSLRNVELIPCSKKYRTKNTVIYRSQLCTWKLGKDACQGDSGSAAMEVKGTRWFQVGIVSYGTTCADEFPGVFTKVSYFITWIIKSINENKR